MALSQGGEKHDVFLFLHLCSLRKKMWWLVDEGEKGMIRAAELK